MTLRGKYQEAMSHVEVTEEMRTRVLENVNAATGNANAEDRSVKSDSNKNIIRFSSLRRYASAAAVFAVMIIGAFIYRNVSAPVASSGNGDASGEEVLVTSGIQEYMSLDELEASIGFEVEELSAIPFEVEEVSYLDITGEIAEIDYVGASQSISCRKSRGTEDNSGDYNEYSEVSTVQMGENSVTLKGDTDGYSLVYWMDGEFFYSISSTEAYAEDVWADIILNK